MDDGVIKFYINLPIRQRIMVPRQNNVQYHQNSFRLESIEIGHLNESSQTHKKKLFPTLSLYLYRNSIHRHCVTSGTLWDLTYPL